MCLYPRLIENRKYKANKKNNGIIPIMKDKRAGLVPVGCGKCMECKKQKGREWSVRLQEEIRVNKNGKFVTLSFSDESLTKLQKDIKGLKGYELENETATKAVRKFLERWRKKYKKSVRHWLVTELGQNKTERIHIHGIIFTDKEEEIEKIWKYGNVWIGDYVNERTINYIVKYISKIDEKHKYYNSKILTSKGIGSNYFNRLDSKINKEKKLDFYKLRNGVKLALPTYYRNKLYDDETREKLWLKRLDENVRYVNGIKIDVSNNDDIYYNALKQARIENKEKGFGDNSKDWDKIRYERERREILKKIRLNKNK